MLKNLKDALKTAGVSLGLTYIVTTLLGIAVNESINLAMGVFICMFAFTPTVIVSLISVAFLRGINNKTLKFLLVVCVGLPFGILTGVMLWPIPVIVVPLTALYFTFYINKLEDV